MFISCRASFTRDTMTYEVPSVDDATEEAGGALGPMMEGAAVGAGIEVGGGLIPVIGEAVGGFGASLALSNQDAKTYGNRMAAFEAAQRLLE